MLGTKTFPVGAIPFKVSGGFKALASVRLSVEAGRCFVSGAFEDGAQAPTFQKSDDWLARFEREELRKRTVSVDRGVAIPAMAPTSQAFRFSDVHRQRMAKKEAGRNEQHFTSVRETCGGTLRTRPALL